MSSFQPHPHQPTGYYILAQNGIKVGAKNRGKSASTFLIKQVRTCKALMTKNYDPGWEDLEFTPRLGYLIFFKWKLRYSK